MLYAYDIEMICAQVFPGSSSDTSLYPSFIRENDIRKDIIVADKAFLRWDIPVFRIVFVIEPHL